MKYISIDVETTGLNPETCQILSFAAVVEDTKNRDVPVEELPFFYKIFNLEYIKGEPFALNLNKSLIEIIKEGKDKDLIYPENFSTSFSNFLMDNNIYYYNEKLKVAGKNFNSFDKLFIQRIPKFNSLFKIHQRVLDVGTMFVDFKTDDWIPNLDTCKKRAGINGEVTHNALDDARDVILTLRSKY